MCEWYTAVYRGILNTTFVSAALLDYLHGDGWWEENANPCVAVRCFVCSCIHPDLLPAYRVRPSRCFTLLPNVYYLE